MGEYRGVELDGAVLNTERLALRPWQPADAPSVYEAMQDSSIRDFVVLPDPYRPQDAEQFVTAIATGDRHRGTGLGCALVESATGRLVGSADIRLPPPRKAAADIGYVIYAPARGHGYAAEASRALASWALRQGVARVEIRCAVANVASAKSALNGGFRYEGILRGDIATPTGMVDGAVFGRLAGDPGMPVPRRFVALPAGGLSDGVLELRMLLPADVAAMLEQETDPITVSTGFTGITPSEADITRMVAQAGLDWLVGSAAPFAMLDVATGQLAGSMRLRLVGPPGIGGVGYAVHPAFRGRGYTARALRLLVRWAFDVGGFARLELGAKTSNVASQKAAQAAGFEPDGVLRARLRDPEGTFSDEARFAVVNPRLPSVG
ncbi:MAG: GNAT family N-acetyltransferase [Actinomycetota bacterium]|nr:GNAT family N-acetyltransferase [Actinomycetota bacterium]